MYAYHIKCYLNDGWDKALSIPFFRYPWLCTGDVCTTTFRVVFILLLGEFSLKLGHTGGLCNIVPINLLFMTCKISIDSVKGIIRYVNHRQNAYRNIHKYAHSAVVFAYIWLD